MILNRSVTNIVQRGTFVWALLVVVPVGGFSKPCSKSTLNGTYALQASGNIIPPIPGLVGPFARAGRSTFDGKGNLSNVTVGSYNGAIFSEPYTGTYNVNADCTAQVIANLGAPVTSPVAFTGVISEDGDLGQFILINPPISSIHVTIRRQRKKCSHEDLDGTFGLESSGVIVSGPFAGPHTRVGIVENSKGQFSASTTATYNGAPAPENYSGTYVVNSDCTVEFQVNAPLTQGPAKYFGAFSDNGDKIVFIVSDPPGSVILGSMSKQ